MAHLELNLPPGVEPYISNQGVAFSPDGARVAFIGIVAGYKQVYLRDLDKFDAVAVRGTDKATSVFFSPNGRAIGVILANPVLKRVSLEDGLVVDLARGADIHERDVGQPARLGVSAGRRAAHHRPDV